jgi:polysaccharide export outer membrane protein
MTGINKAGLLVLLAMASWSCVPNGRISYVQKDKEVTPQQSSNMYFIDEELDNTIKIGDELYIGVTSADENPTAFSERTNNQVYDPTVISHTVDENGEIKLPYIKTIKVSGLTLVEASDAIERELSQFMYYPSVFIRFVNNKITILGEVNRPGVYVFNYKNINILQAIGYANDISIFGDRKKVIIIREEGNYRSRYEVDLTSENLLSSPLYQLKTNDIVYVDPLKRKKWAMSQVPYDLILSIVSLSIVVMTFMVTYYY